MSDITLSVSHLTKKIGKRAIIKDISFELKAEKYLVFLDQMVLGKQQPSGCLLD